MVPSPCPSVAVVNSIQFAAVDEDQLHSRATVTVTWPVPPEGPKLCDGFVSETWQRVVDGAVTLVEVVAELPQATAAIAAAIEKSRARTRPFTRLRNTSHAPATI